MIANGAIGGPDTRAGLSRNELRAQPHDLLPTILYTHWRPDPM
jgi:hypothetical protein